jgi:DNA invertase Pin-like site-specific DNA recombinase
MAAYERALIQTRTTAALRVKKIKGERVGAVPLGYAADGGGRLVPCAHEQATLARMRELAAQGCSQPQICRVLTSEEYQPRGSKWNVTTIARVLRRAE